MEHQLDQKQSTGQSKTEAKQSSGGWNKSSEKQSNGGRKQILQNRVMLGVFWLRRVAGQQQDSCRISGIRGGYVFSFFVILFRAIKAG